MRVTKVIPLVAVATFGVLVAGAAPGRAAGSLDFSPQPPPSLGNFSPIQLNGSPQLTSAALTPFSVTDATGTGAGWNLVFTMSPLTTGGHSFAAGSVTMNRASVTPSAGNTSTPPTLNDCTGANAIDTVNGCAVAVAAPGAGDGTWLFSPAPVVLTVPSNAFAGTYDSTFTVTLSSGP